MCQCFESAPVYGSRAHTRNGSTRRDGSASNAAAPAIAARKRHSLERWSPCGPAHRLMVRRVPFLDSYRVGLAASFRDPGGRTRRDLCPGRRTGFGIYLGCRSRLALLTQRSEFFAEVFGAAEQTAENLGPPDTRGSPGCRDFADVGFFRAFCKRPSDRRRTESWISFRPCADDGF